VGFIFVECWGAKMKKFFITLSILTILFGAVGHLYADLLGITCNGNRLVSFDPYSETLIREHTQLNPNENFKALTYDPNRNKLYALSHVQGHLYAIDVNTLDIEFIGKLNIDEGVSWGEDIGGLTYDLPNPLKTKTV